MRKFDWKTGRNEIKKQLGSEAAKQPSISTSIVGQHSHADRLCFGKETEQTSPAILSSQNSLSIAPSPNLGECRDVVLSPRESGLRAEGGGAFFEASVACKKKVRRPVKREQTRRITERGEQNSFAKQTETCHSELVSESQNLTGNSPLSLTLSLKGRGNKAAFTLAETLITLGIIGVVAALTIPTLIQKYEKQVTATRAKQAYSMISQAIKLSEIDNGRAEDWAVSSQKGLPYTEAFLNKFIFPYLKAEFCGDSNSSDIIKKCGATVSVNGKNYFLANGTAVSFVPSLAFESGIQQGKIHIIIDTNGPKKPNFLGNDQFYFEYYPNNGFKPYAAPANCSRTEILNGTCQFEEKSFGCKKVKNDDEDILYRHGCTLLLMMDSWEFKDDYPW